MVRGINTKLVDLASRPIQRAGYILDNAGTAIKNIFIDGYNRSTIRLGRGFDRLANKADATLGRTLDKSGRAIDNTRNATKKTAEFVYNRGVDAKDLAVSGAKKLGSGVSKLSAARGGVSKPGSGQARKAPLRIATIHGNPVRTADQISRSVGHTVDLVFERTNAALYTLFRGKGKKPSSGSSKKAA